MMVPHMFILLFFVSSTYCFLFNNFEYLTREINLAAGRTGIKTPETCWLEQKLDHFDSNEKRTWKMRYFKRHDIWKKAGPVYVFLAGEGPICPHFLDTGVAYELANETNGAVYVAEHRYYGDSIPVNGTEPKDFKYLSVRQALADYAHLIRIIKNSSKFEHSKVVVIGASYGGNIATWMRLLYPDLVYAAIASSAPVLAKKDFYEYLEKVSDDFKQYGTQECWRTINDRFKYYENMFKTKEGIEKLKKEENVCPDVDMSIPENRQLFFFEKILSFMFIAKYGDVKSIKDRCRKINASKNFSFFNNFGLWSEQKKCHNLDFNHMIDFKFKNQIDLIVSWTYQRCSEFGYFPSTSSDRQPFTNNVPLDFYVKVCTSVFGPEFNNSRIDKEIDTINKMFGGLKPNVTNVVFVNGDLDPWSRLGILESLSDNAPAVVIPRASHNIDIFSNEDGDEQELKDARRKIKNYIKKWVFNNGN